MPAYTHNQSQLFYREQGAGPLLLLLPGNTASSACYQGEMDYFSQHYHVVAPDLRGTGHSERIASWPDTWWEQGAHDVVALLDHLQAETCIAVGSSGGGVVALLLALLSPQRVRAVVADSCTRIFSAPMLHSIVAGREQPPAELAMFWQYAHGDDWQQVVAADSALLLRLAEQGGYDWARERLSQVQCPVLLTASLHDAEIPDIGQHVLAMAQQMPHSQVFLTNAGGHPLMWTRPTQFRCAVTCFLRSALAGQEITAKDAEDAEDTKDRAKKRD
jgi:pimeloyl-ACP methyl ester carboxylesterase